MKMGSGRESHANNNSNANRDMESAAYRAWNRSCGNPLLVKSDLWPLARADRRVLVKGGRLIRLLLLERSNRFFSCFRFAFDKVRIGFRLFNDECANRLFVFFPRDPHLSGEGHFNRFGR